MPCPALPCPALPCHAIQIEAMHEKDKKTIFKITDGPIMAMRDLDKLLHTCAIRRITISLWGGGGGGVELHILDLNMV